MELPAALKKLEEALAEHYGWSGHPLLREKVSAAVTVKAGRLGIAPQEYCQIAAGSQSELLALVEEAASSEAYFFREPDQFKYLSTRILPELISSGPGNEKLRFWSAACSTGEEPYSLAIAFELAKSDGSERQAEIFATDVRNRALLQASQAHYGEASLQGIDHAMRERFFDPSDLADQSACGKPYTVTLAIRRQVTFRRVNLLDKLFWKGVAGKFDLIVCANQLQYFHGAAVRQMAVNLVNSLREGGYLMVSPAEINLINSSRLLPLVDAPSFFRRII